MESEKFRGVIIEFELMAGQRQMQVPEKYAVEMTRLVERGLKLR